MRQWVITAIGFDSTKVIRAEQDGPRPTGIFAEVRVGDGAPVGAVDSHEHVYDSGAAAGEEMVETVRGVREVSATVRVFTPSAVGSESARALLSRAQTALGLEGVRQIFYDAGMTLFDRGGPIQSIPAILDTRWEGRAQLTIRLYVEETATATTGYIASTELTDQSVDPPETFIVDGG